MKKTVFTNLTFKTIILVIFSILITLNIYNLLDKKILISIVPILIQAIVIIFIIKDHKYAKLGIKIWSIFIIVAYGISFAGKLIKLFIENNNFSEKITPLLEQILFLLIGFMIFYYNNKTVEIKDIDQTKKG